MLTDRKRYLLDPPALSDLTAPGCQDRAAVIPGLVTEAQRGDRESFGRIFDLYHLPVYRYVLARVGSAADAEDIAAETFVAAFGAIGRFRWQGPPFEAWLFRIARSKIADHQRRLHRRPPPANIDACAPDLLVGDEDVANQVVRRDEQQRVLGAMSHLSNDQRDVLALRFFAGLSLEEAAGALGRSPAAVKQLQFRAVTALRRRMEVKQ